LFGDFGKFHLICSLLAAVGIYVRGADFIAFLIVVCDAGLGNFFGFFGILEFF
jgi:hypothetical protein